jgi:hypothetical protein
MNSRTGKIMKLAEEQTQIEHKRYVRKRAKYFLWRWRQVCKGRSFLIAELRLLRYHQLVEKEKTKSEKEFKPMSMKVYHQKQKNEITEIKND